MITARLPSERLYKHHRRQWQRYLLFCVVSAVGSVIAILIPGESENPKVLLMPVLSVLALMVAAHLVARWRNAAEFREETRRIVSDEWIQGSLHRSQRQALMAVIFGQGPLMFFMAYVPPEPSVFGMGMVTVMLGCGVMAGGFLFHTREHAGE
jgi:uncharacterized membrane protein YfcA